MADYVIGRAARATPQKTALLVVTGVPASGNAESWSYAQLETAVLRIAASLAATGIRPGDRVLIRLENTSLYALLFFGAIAGGFVPVPTSAQLTPREALDLVADCEAEVVAVSERLFCDIPSDIRVLREAEIKRMLDEPARSGYSETAPEDPAFLVYTSGTSGRPKGVLHAHRSALGRRPMYDGWYGIGADDRMLHAGSFNWTYTLGTGLTDPWANGATAVLYTGEKDPASWPCLIEATGASLFAAVPSLYRQILKYADVNPAALATLRHGLVAGETPPPGLFEAWTERTGKELYEALGMSEISTYVSSGPAAPRRSGAVGRPQTGRRVVVLPCDGGDEPLPSGREGLLAVHRSDPGLMLGYWRAPIEDREARRGEWFIGGDLARMDAEGYVTHLGRADDVMNALGYRVAPQEVEAVLALHPDVAEVACAEVRVRADVTVIGAFVVPREGASPSRASIETFAAERLADYKRPREIVFMDALPRTANGKIKRAGLAFSREPHSRT